MTKEQIFESGFIQAFINEFFEDKIHSFYPDKLRLLYILCENEQEKKEVTKEQIKTVKAIISELGFEDLSFAYLLSCKVESLHNYIEPNKRFDFWLRRFSEEFEDHITDFDPITKAICLYNEVSELSVEVFENEGEFWVWYPKSQSPKTRDFLSIISNEADLLSLIEFDIKEYNKNEYWEFDFEEYQKFIDVSKPLELLFNLSELLVQLNRLEMFKEFLEIDDETLPPRTITKQKTELKIDQIALKYAYEGIQITRENGNDIAQKYGHNSGEKLFQRFTYFSSSANRKGKPNLCTPKKLDNKIKLIESIIELLPIDKQERAKDEVSILKKIFEAEYQ
jgi:hypothetical protein